MKKSLYARIIAGTMLAGAALLLWAGVAPAWEPLAYPYLVWGEISKDVAGDRGEGFKLDTRAEQGVDVLGFGPDNRFRVTPFVGLRVTLSDRSEEPWNNKIGPDFGVKLRYAIPMSPGHWGQLALGIRGEQINFLSGDRPAELRGVVFLSYGFGGDWRKR